MRRIPSADVIGNASRPKALSQAKAAPQDDDVFKVPPLPDLKGKGKVLDIAKELEKANKAVGHHARFFFFFPLNRGVLAAHRWSSALQVIASLNTGFTKPMQTLKKSGVSYIVGLNLLWWVCLLVHETKLRRKGNSQRGQMQSRAIESRAAEKFAKAHAEMYVKRTIPGGCSGVQEGRNRCSSINGRPHDNGS
jgi:hypothetical protein